MNCCPFVPRHISSKNPIGRWDGDVLVVDTVGFLPGLLTGQLLHGDQLHIAERFSVDTETMALKRDYMAVHPCKELMNVDYSVAGEETATESAPIRQASAESAPSSGVDRREANHPREGLTSAAIPSASSG